MRRTRIKICGLTRVQDVHSACDLGADAVGFVCYPASPRFVDTARLAELARAVPPMVAPVLLFVNATASDVGRALGVVPNALLQFHGERTMLPAGPSGAPTCAQWRSAQGSIC